jgi:Permease for cytosine/purines, uracil, thiamine, allantoin
MIDFKKGGYIAALIALILYPFAPWQGSAATFVGFIGSTMGPIFGVIMVDYYLILNSEIDVPELYREEGAYRYTNGWNVNAVIAAAVGAVFSSILPNFTNTCRPGGASTAGSSGSRSVALSTTSSSRLAERPPLAWLDRHKGWPRRSEPFTKARDCDLPSELRRAHLVIRRRGNGGWRS